MKSEWELLEDLKLINEKIEKLEKENKWLRSEFEKMKDKCAEMTAKYKKELGK